MEQEIDTLRVSPNPKKVHREPSVLKRIAMVGLVWSGIYAYANQLPELEKREAVVPYSQLLKQAIDESIGKDRIWTDQEKIDFLKSNGLENVTLQVGQSLHFRINNRSDSRGGIHVFTDTPRRNSDNYLGKISRDVLQAYVDSGNSK